MSGVGAYRLWSVGRSQWCGNEIVVEPQHIPAICSLFDGDWSTTSYKSARPDVALIPEPAGPRGQWAISVRFSARTLGYMAELDAPKWAGVVRRVIASGLIPTTRGYVSVRNYEGWDGPDRITAIVAIGLGEPDAALPINDPPAVPHTLLPRSSIVQVTKEDLHPAVLKFVPSSGYGVLLVTLHEAGVTGKPHVEIRIDDERIGQLTAAMSARFLPMIRCLRDRGLLTACWGDITGSAVAAEVRIDAVKANEADDDVLYGRPIEVPWLVPELSEPRNYDLTAVGGLLDPLPSMLPPLHHIHVEPDDGALVRFSKGNGYYHYVAVRRHDHWETTSTRNLGEIDEVVVWKDLAARVRRFDVAAAWSTVALRGDLRVRERHAVIRFTINGLYLAAINIANDYAYEGDWYTTISDDVERSLPFGERATWSDITRHGRYIEVVTAWRALA